MSERSESNGGPGRIRTYEGIEPADLQSAPFDRFGTDPFKKLPSPSRCADPPTGGESRKTKVNGTSREPLPINQFQINRMFICLEPMRGFEPRTYSLPWSCSTN